MPVDVRWQHMSRAGRINWKIQQTSDGWEMFVYVCTYQSAKYILNDAINYQLSWACALDTTRVWRRCRLLIWSVNIQKYFSRAEKFPLLSVAHFMNGEPPPACLAAMSAKIAASVEDQVILVIACRIILLQESQRWVLFICRISQYIVEFEEVARAF